MKVEHILIIRFSPLGDVVMTTPVVKALATQYPDVRITMLSCEEARPLFGRMPQNVSFMAADLKHEYYGVKGLNALYRRLTAKNFTAIADFHSVLKSDYLRMRFNIDRFKVAHVDKHRSMRRQLTARSNKRMVQMPTVFQSYADVLARLGYPVRLDEVPASVFGDMSGEPLPPEAGGEKNPGSVWIGIAPSGGYEGKTYPAHLLGQVMAALEQRYEHLRIFLFTDNKDDSGMIDGLCRTHPCCINVSEMEGGIDAGLRLMSRLDLMLSMDNLFMHLASVAGTPVLSIWGATHPYGGHTGWRQPQDSYMQTEQTCRPCSIHGRKDCLTGGYPCMNGIMPATVIEKAKAMLREKGIQA